MRRMRRRMERGEQERGGPGRQTGGLARQMEMAEEADEAEEERNEESKALGMGAVYGHNR
jgi:hypothetical protein